MQCWDLSSVLDLRIQVPSLRCPLRVTVKGIVGESRQDQEQVLGSDDPRGPHCHDGEPQHVREQMTGNVEERNPPPIMP